ncbi:MAG: hypothetical protein RL119_255 [Actinomycetota bacterium]
MSAGQRTLSSGPPEQIGLSQGLVIRRYRREDARALGHAVTQSIDHLRPWMPWVQFEPQSVEQREQLIDQWIASWDSGTEFVMGLFEDETCIGSTGVHLRGEEGTVDLGYWLVSTHIGRGIMTAVVHQLFAVSCAFSEINCVDIVNDAANVASGAVARRCGFSMIEEFEHEIEAPSESGRRLRWRKPCLT